LTISWGRLAVGRPVILGKLNFTKKREKITLEIEFQEDLKIS
jgi:hypothetical protein